jgi:hypothetical protein
MIAKTGIRVLAWAKLAAGSGFGGRRQVGKRSWSIKKIELDDDPSPSVKTRIPIV